MDEVNLAIEILCGKKLRFDLNNEDFKLLKIDLEYPSDENITETCCDVITNHLLSTNNRLSKLEEEIKLLKENLEIEKCNIFGCMLKNERIN